MAPSGHTTSSTQVCEFICSLITTLHGTARTDARTASVDGCRVYSDVTHKRAPWRSLLQVYSAELHHVLPEEGSPYDFYKYAGVLLGSPDPKPACWPACL